ncbi:MAG: response regulator [Geminicoccaceae bacterium]
MDRFFDLIEIGFTSEWAELERDQRIAELQRANRSIMDEKNKYLTIFESVRTPILIVGPDGAIDAVNLAAQQIFGGSVSPGAGYYRGRRVPLLDEQLPVLAGLAQSGDEAETVLRTPSGPRSFVVKVQRLLDISEKFLGTVLILTDVTDYLHAVERAQAAEQARSAFLATITHELRTPLNGILGGAMLLRRDNDPAYLDAIMSSAESLLLMVDDILDYSRIEAGAVELQPAPFRVGDLVSSAIRVVETRAREKHLSVQTQIGAADGRVLLADHGKIRRVLLSLLDNAVKFTAEGRIIVTTSLETDPSSDAARLLITVADTGVGLPQENVDWLFEPFVQGSDPVHQGGGAGLGLAIARRLTELTGGMLTGTNRPGGGSAFTIDLPVRLLGALPEPTSAPVPASGRVLVVDDDEVSRLVTAGMLNASGYAVATAASVGDALAALGEQAFDAIVLDMHLPDASGPEIVRRIRGSSSSEPASTPLVGLTAHVDADERRRVLAEGLHSILVKPCEADDLDKAIRRARAARTADIPDAQPSTGAGDPFLDERLLLAHLDALGPPAVTAIIEAFERTADRTSTSLSAQGDPRAMAEALHQLKGAAATLGLKALQRTCAALEQSRITDASVRLARLDHVLRPTREALSAFRRDRLT